jgi:hypothetical protein
MVSLQSSGILVMSLLLPLGCVPSGCIKAEVLLPQHFVVDVPRDPLSPNRRTKYPRTMPAEGSLTSGSAQGPLTIGECPRRPHCTRDVCFRDTEQHSSIRPSGLRVYRLERRFGHPRRDVGLLHALEGGHCPASFTPADLRSHARSRATGSNGACAPLARFDRSPSCSRS